MANSSKLKNIDAINRMLRGEHKTQTKKVFGYRNIEKAQEDALIRKIGETWNEYDADGRLIAIWEQHEGWRSKRPPMSDSAQETRDYLRKFNNCPKETCTCTNPTSLDKKFKLKLGMCFDCVTELETKMKIGGTFDSYAADKVYQNVQAFFRDRDQELEDMKRSVKSGYGFSLESGEVESWNSENPQAMIDQIESGYLEYKQRTLEFYNPDKLAE